MEQKPIPYERQIFVCINDHKGEKPSCADHQALEIFLKLRQAAKERGLHPRIRVTQVKCLGQCQSGVTVMVSPGDVWYSHVRVSDISTLVEKHLSTS